MSNIKTKIKDFFKAPGMKFVIPALLTVLVYYFSNNTADIVLFQVGHVAVSVAVLFFSVSFFLKDFIQKKFGTQFAIWNTILATLIVAILFIQSALVGGQGDYTYFLVLMVSTLSAIVCETIDSFVFRNIFKKDTTKSVRSSLISNLISVPLDTLIFSYLALYTIIGLPIELVVALATGQIIIKYILSALLTPVIARTKAGSIWKTKEA